MTISDDVLRIWMRDAKRYLPRYWNHSHYDDIVASAYLTMWEALLRADERKVKDLKGYAMRAAWNGAQAYLSSPANECRTWNIFKQKAVQPLLYLEDVRAGRSDEWEPGRGVEPDFVPALVERLAAEQELARLSPPRRAAIWLTAYCGLTRDQARRQLGWSRTRIDYYLRGISRAAVPNSHPGGPRVSPKLTMPRDAAGRFSTAGQRP